MLDQYTASYLAALTPLITVITAFIIPFLSSLSRKPQRFAFILSEIIFLLNAFSTFLVFYYVYKTGNILVYMFAGFPPPLGIIYEIDYLNALIGLLIGLIFPIINIASYNYLEKITKHNEWYYVLYLGLETGLIGMAYTGDLFNLFVMLEVTSITAYALTSYLREKGYTLNAALKYGFFGAVGSTIYFIAVVLLYSGIGTLSMPDVVSDSLGLSYFNESVGIASSSAPILVLFAGLAVWAFLIESAIFPHHFWLPDAYTSMPSTVAATMAAVAEGVGAYVIMRIMYTVIGVQHIYWIQVILLILGSANIILGGYLMTTANNVKRLIAYSTILDMGYVAIGIGLGSETALKATLFYIIAHTIVKPLLFLTAGIIESTTGTTDMDKLAGLLRTEPLIALSLLIGGLAVIGVPPLNMFFAKLSLFIAVFEAKTYILLIVMLIGSALSFAGFSRLWYITLVPRTRKAVEAKKLSVGLETETILVLLIILTIVTGIIYGWINDKILSPAVNTLLSDQHRIDYAYQAYRLYKLIGG